MINSGDHTRKQIIDNVKMLIASKLSVPEANVLSTFIEQYYATVSPDDLAERSSADLYGALISHWNLICNHKPGQTRIKIYNPHQEMNGWQSNRTIVEVISEDKPFLVDSLRMELNRNGYNIYLIIHMGKVKFTRDKNGKIDKILEKGDPNKNAFIEAPIYIEIDRQTDQNALAELHDNLMFVLEEVNQSVADWKQMTTRLEQAVKELEQTSRHLDPEQVSESIDFLNWLRNDHFTFLGSCEFALRRGGGALHLEVVSDSQLGIMRDDRSQSPKSQSNTLTPEARSLLESQQILIISKSDMRSRVHRPVYTENISVKRFDQSGQVIGELRIVGLYTSVAYNSNPKHIPFLRRKVAQVLERSGIDSKSHAGKTLLNILETLPRDDLFQATVHELLDLSLGILHLQERRRIRLFARQDVYGRFISCLVYVPREQFNTELREAIEDILKEEFNASEISFAPQFSDSVLARIHFVIRVKPSEKSSYALQHIERRLVDIARTWHDDLADALLDHFGEERGRILMIEYGRAFGASYREDFLPRTAAYDVEHLEKIKISQRLGMSFYRPLHVAAKGFLRFKLFSLEQTIPLSDILPMLENMGLRVLGERPYRLISKSGTSFWINDFGMMHQDGDELNVEDIKDKFHEAFSRAWYGEIENDGFNQLVLAGNMSWYETNIFRSYAKYFKQINFTFSQNYIEKVVTKHANIAKMILELFYARFDPNSPVSEIDTQIIEDKIIEALEAVSVLDEDRIMRRYLEVIKATLRTNFFQLDSDGKFKSYISFKLASDQIPEIPLPFPKFEIFVYSPDFEGVHLRGAKVARGGLRWSDRREDFRTEILGLMKAQSVKNAVIVPAGAKGGFVPKRLVPDASREQTMQEVVCCYQNFIRGLLDITDNFLQGVIVKPNAVRCYDEDDHYLVVAADKGTATFSDTANQISKEYGFWLGDAFASGGSAGYDHKKMAITARGGWVSVQRAFRECGINIQKTPFTVVGIGDMSGDVFGNGMLLSPTIKLVGAFNHMHIFIDPDPDMVKSFAERQRLFALPRSTWEDYNLDLISRGGGVFKRTAKSIRLTPEMKALLSVNNDIVVPNELIRALLRAPVDLIWNGGIGTYVKSSSESHASVGDRTNDALRVNANELCCKIIGEGGNLGLTQLARVEFCLNGGMVNSDFIDNSGGVDCSDHEVNLKILLNGIITNGDMTEKQRNQLLLEMTDEVANLVLDNNYQQTLAISISERRAPEYVELHTRFIQDLERAKKINRKLEFLPTDKALRERKSKNAGLTRPEIAILLAYNKIVLKEAILDSEVPDDEYLSKTIETAFPRVIAERFHDALYAHSLRREIIATQLSNQLVNEMGVTFLHRLHDETGAPMTVIVRAYRIVRDLFDVSKTWSEIRALDYMVSSDIQYRLHIDMMRLIRRSTRWFLRNRRVHLMVESTIAEFKPGIQILTEHLPTLIVGAERENIEKSAQEYIEKGVSSMLAEKIAYSRAMFCALDIIQAAHQYAMSITEVANMYFSLGDKLELSWVREQLTMQPVDSRWDALIREALRDDLDWQQRDLSIAVLFHHIKSQNFAEKIDEWAKSHKGLCHRWEQMLADLRSRSVLDFTMFSVAVRELLDLAQTSVHHPQVVANIPILSQQNGAKQNEVVAYAALEKTMKSHREKASRKSKSSSITKGSS